MESLQDVSKTRLSVFAIMSVNCAGLSEKP